MGEAAVIVCPAEAPASQRPALSLGGLSLLARSLLTARHAGCERLVVVGAEDRRAVRAPDGSDDPRLDGVEWLEAAEAPAVSRPCLLVRPEVVVTPGDLRAWRERVPETAGLAAPDAGGLGPVVVPPDLLPACVAAARAGRSGLAAFLSGRAGSGGLAEIPWRGALREPVESAGEVPGVERKLLLALRTPEDGPLVDRHLNRTVSGWLTRRLVRTAVTPNQVTVASLLSGLLGAWCLGYGGWLPSLAGLLLFQWSVILDHADGEIARLTFRFSPFGKWLDNWSDHAVGVAVIAMLAWRAGAAGDGSLLLLGLAAVVGVTGAFLLVFRWSLASEAATRSSGLDALANRDGFYLALWGAVLVGRPTWFLWALAVGANLFWLIWLWRVGLPRGGGAARCDPPGRPPPG